MPVVALAGALAGTLTACERTSPERDARAGGGAAAPSGIRYLAADGTPEDGFAYATSPPELAFPEDHADHPEYRTEWWYFTGNLESESGGHYGFELTIFRFALAPEPPAGDSAWATNQVWMAHLAVTDARAGRMIAEERLTRGALGLAGAARDPVSVWVESWSITALPEPRHAFVIDAHGDRIGLQLRLEALKPPVTHGDDGLDPKGPEPGNASHYYSLTRIAAEGEVTVDGMTETVTGLAWMDREWSTSALSPDVEGWDWFALQLSDGRDLMLYRLRRRDGTTSPFSGGSLVDARGERTPLGPTDFALESLAAWESPLTGVRYPVAWRVSVPPASLELDVRPVVEDQEIRLSVRYWEGAVQVEGRGSGEPITGRGYLELAGY